MKLEYQCEIKPCGAPSTGTDATLECDVTSPAEVCRLHRPFISILFCPKMSVLRHPVKLLPRISRSLILMHLLFVLKLNY